MTAIITNIFHPLKSDKPYRVEAIPNTHYLYLRVHKNDLDCNEVDKNKKIQLGAFKPKGNDELSVNWSKHSTPKDSMTNPEVQGVVSFRVLKLRIPELGLQVLHDPWKPPTHPIDNRAHSVIKGLPPKGPSKTRMRVILRDLCEWEIEYNEKKAL